MLSPSEMVQADGISGLTMRQPRVVECSVSCPRGNGVEGLVSTHGARVIDSTPPATTSSASPHSTARRPWIAASNPLPHRRFTVAPGTDVGQPASSTAMRATSRLSSPGTVRVAEQHVVDVARGRGRGCARRGCARRGRRGRRAGRRPAPRRSGRTASGRRRARRRRCAQPQVVPLRAVASGPRLRRGASPVRGGTILCERRTRGGRVMDPSAPRRDGSAPVAWLHAAGGHGRVRLHRLAGGASAEPATATRSWCSTAARGTRAGAAVAFGRAVTFGTAKSVASAFAGADAVVHLAAKVGVEQGLADLPDYVAHNDLGTAVVLSQAARLGVERIVLASSMVVYGEGLARCGDARSGAARGAASGRPRQGAVRAAVPRLWPARWSRALVGEDVAPDPRSGYAASKVAQEELCGVWARHSGGSVAALRFHNVYGPRYAESTRPTPVSRRSSAAGSSRGLAPLVTEDGGQRRDLVHVRDVAAACVRAVESTVGPPGHHPRLQHRQRCGAHRAGPGLARWPRAAGVAEPEVTGAARLADVRHITADSARARAELRWQAREDFGQVSASCWATRPRRVAAAPRRRSREVSSSPSPGHRARPRSPA